MGLLLICLFLGVVSSSFLEDGMEYVYDVEIYQNTGTLDYQPAAAALATKWRVQMQVSGDTLNVRQSQFQHSQYVGSWGHDNKADWPWHRNTFENIQGPSTDFSIQYSNGLVTGLSLPASLSASERNQLRAFAASWQINTEDKPFFRAEEALLHGSCRVQYTVVPGVVTKAVSHFKDCSDRVYRHVDNFRGYRCDGQWSMEAHGHGDKDWHEGRTSPEPIYSNSNMMFFVEKKGSKYQVNKMVSAGAVAAQFYESAGVSHFVHVNRSMTLVGAQASSGSISPSNLVATSLSYEWEVTGAWDSTRDLLAREPYFSAGEHFQEDQATLMAALVDVLANMFAGFDLHGHDRDTIEKLHKYGAGSAMPILYALDFNSLKEVFNQLKADSSEAGVAKQNMFREFATEAGTTAAAMWIKDAVSKNLFSSEADSARAVTGMAFHIRRPNLQLVEEFAELTEKHKDTWGAMVGPLALAHLVRRTCELAGSATNPERQRCMRELVNPWADKFFSELSSTSSEARKHLLMGAMLNLYSPRVTELLKPMAYGEVAGVDDNLQKKAIRASLMGTFYTQSTVEFMLPIFLNMRHGHESRIAAIDAIFSMMEVDVTTLSTIMIQMYAEPDYELMNYVFTLFEKHAYGQNSCFSERKTERIRYFLKYMKQAGLHTTNYGLGVSKTHRQSFQQEKYGYGGGYEYWVLGSHKSASPLELAFRIDTNLYNGYTDNMLMVILRVEGLAKGIVNNFHKLGKEWKVEQLKALFSSMGVVTKPDVPIRVELSFMLKNVVVAQSVYTSADAEEGGKLRNLLKDLQGQSANSYTINHQRGLSMGSSIYEQPTDSGLPMAHVSASTSLASLEATVQRGLRRGVIFRDLDYNIHLLNQGTDLMLFKHPGSKISYGIVQDRVLTTHFPRHIRLGVNLVKKELRIQVSEPALASPLLIVMHSRTKVTASGASLSGDTDISGTCPTCAGNTWVVSKGDAAMKGRSIFDTSSKNFGSVMKAEFFDCEMDLEEGKTVGSTVSAFLPFNKSPKNPLSLLMLGVRQVRSYFTNFPRAEQCGAFAYYSQSPDHPVSEIDISIQGKRVANQRSQRLGMTGQTTFLKLKVTANGANGARENRELKVNIKYDSGVMGRKNELKLQFARLPNANVGIEPYMVCFSMENKYSNSDVFERELMGLDLATTLEVTGKADIKYGVGTTCGAAVGSTDVTFRHSTTELARQELKETDYYKTCMEQKASPEWATRTGAPYTTECWLTEVDAARARKYTWDMNFEKTTPMVQSWLEKAHTLVKAGLLPYWDVDPEALAGALSNTPKIGFEFVFKNQDRTIDATIITEKGTSRFPDVVLPIPFGSSNLRQLRLDESMTNLIKSRLASVCIQTSSSLVTLDGTVLPAPASDCWTLVSGHCAPAPTFAVLTRRDDNMPLAMKVYLGGHVVEFTPTSRTDIKVTHNGQEVRVQDQDATDGTEGKTKLFTLAKWGSVYTLWSNWNVVVLFDGTFVEIIPAPWVKGQHCGVCGNFDGNKKNELLNKIGAPVSSGEVTEAWCQ